MRGELRLEQALYKCFTKPRTRILLISNKGTECHTLYRDLMVQYGVGIKPGTDTLDAWGRRMEFVNGSVIHFVLRSYLSKELPDRKYDAYVPPVEDGVSPEKREWMLRYMGFAPLEGGPLTEEELQAIRNALDLTKNYKVEGWKP